MTSGQESQTTTLTQTCPACGMRLAASVVVCPRDGTQLSSAISVDPAFNKYEFLETIGEGGMGVIYKARHLVLGKFVAIKTLHSHISSPESIRRFQIEGQAASKLSHPNIVSFYDLGVTQSSQPYIIMEYVDGDTLSEVLKRDGQLSMARFIHIFIQMCDGLAQAHRKAVLHRDIKPSNIMIVRNAEGKDDVRIMDFGIAKMMDDTNPGAQHLTKTGDAIGSPLYMSPEQARGARADQRSDLYSLGCVMYEVLTGSPPFQGNTALETMLLHLEAKPVSMKQASLGREIDARLEAIVMKSLEKNPVDRYQSTDDLKADLLSLHDSEPGPDKPGHKSPGNDAKDRQAAGLHKRKLGFIGLLAIMFCLSVGGYFVFREISHRRHEAAPTASTTASSSDKGAPAAVDTAVEPRGDANAVSRLTGGKFELLPDMRLKPDRLSEVLAGNREKIHVSEIFFDPDDWDKLRDEDLAPLKESTSAQEIDLTYLHVTDKVLEYLKDLPVLRDLRLAKTKVETLAPLMNAKITKLDVEGTRLKPSAYAVIGSMKGLRILTLIHTNINDSELRNLYGLNNLAFVDLSSCRLLTLPAVDALQNALGACSIRYAPYIEENETGEQLLAEARTLYNEKKFAQANFKVAQALSFTARMEYKGKDALNFRDTVEVLQMKADCLVAAKLYTAAAHFSGIAAYEVAKAEPHSFQAGVLYEKTASASERSGDKSLLPHAIECRLFANEAFSKVFKSGGAQANACLPLWKSDLFGLIADFVARDNLPEAESYARALLDLPLSPAEKQRAQVALTDVLQKEKQSGSPKKM